MGLVPGALVVLNELLYAESEAVRIRAVAEVLDRGGLKVAEELALIPQETTNADLDAAIASALAQRDLTPGSGPSDPDYPEALEEPS